jgi:hypothetical protein
MIGRQVLTSPSEARTQACIQIHIRIHSPFNFFHSEHGRIRNGLISRESVRVGPYTRRSVSMDPHV